jgi:hypothetical protein
MGEELVERAGRCDHDCRSGGKPASGAPRLLPRRSDGAGVADEDCRTQPADIDPQLERVRRHDGFDRAFPQAFFDLPSLAG